MVIVLGRIHSAVISGVNPEMRSVTVEWFEKGETKGKEVRSCQRLKGKGVSGLVMGIGLIANIDYRVSNIADSSHDISMM